MADLGHGSIPEFDGRPRYRRPGRRLGHLDSWSSFFCISAICDRRVERSSSFGGADGLLPGMKASAAARIMAILVSAILAKGLLERPFDQASASSVRFL